jgi:excisionase family DNA binding protein
MNQLIITSIDSKELVELIEKAVAKSIMKNSFTEPLNKKSNTEYLTKQEAIKFLSISRPTFDKLRKNGKLKEIKLGGRVLFDKTDIIEFIEKSKTSLWK